MTTESTGHEGTTMGRARYRIVQVKGCGKVAVKNTSPFPDNVVTDMVRHALQDVNCDQTAIHVKSGSYGGGFAYYYVPWGYKRDVEIPHWVRHLITARSMGKHDGNPAYLVGLIAHEAKHIEEWRERRYRLNKETRQTEARARAFENGRKRAWVERQAS